MNRRRGAILIDVLAALVILGTTVATLALAQWRSLAQVAATRQKAVASSLARDLITSWRLEDTRFSDFDEGEFEEQEGWSWRRSRAWTTVDPGIEMPELTLEILALDSNGVSQVVTTVSWLERSIDDQ